MNKRPTATCQVRNILRMRYMYSLVFVANKMVTHTQRAATTTATTTKTSWNMSARRPGCLTYIFKNKFRKQNRKYANTRAQRRRRSHPTLLFTWIMYKLVSYSPRNAANHFGHNNIVWATNIIFPCRVPRGKLLLNEITTNKCGIYWVHV